MKQKRQRKKKEQKHDVNDMYFKKKVYLCTIDDIINDETDCE